MTKTTYQLDGCQILKLFKTLENSNLRFVSDFEFRVLKFRFTRIRRHGCE